MENYLELTLDGKLYTQRTPHSKIVVYDKNNEKIKTLEDVPQILLDVIDIKEKIEESPSRYFDYTIENDEVIIKKMTDNNEFYIYIPETIDGYPVTTIESEVLKDVEKKVQQIHLPDTITRIEYGAFRGGGLLEYINIPKNLIEIPDFCFSLCYKLKDIDLKNIRKIGIHAFEECINLTNIDASNTEIIGEYAFCNCLNLETIKLCDTIYTINKGTFAYCEKLKEVFLPDSINDIASRAFEECVALENIRFSENIKFIGAAAFKFCESLKEFIAPKELLEIQASAFQNSGLEKIIFNKKLKEIDLFAFSKCDKANYVEIYPETKYSSQSFSQQMKYGLKIVKDEISIEEQER